MAIPLTPEIIEAAYAYLITTPPFSRWNLPHPEDMHFSVAKSRHYAAWYTAKGLGKVRKRTIVVSKNLTGHTSSLMSYISHEVVHLHMDLSGMDGSGEHGKAFHKLAAQVCRIHGWDVKTF